MDATDDNHEMKNLRCTHVVSFAPDPITNDTEEPLSDDSVFDAVPSDGSSNTNITDISSEVSASTIEKLHRLKSRLKMSDLSSNELELKASLYFHICNPLKRWKLEKLVPYKLVLQILKTVFLIVQVVLFSYIAANERAVYKYNTSLLFQELFIQSYSATDAKPLKRFMSRTLDQIMNEITFAVERYYLLPNITIGSYGYALNESNSEPLLMKAIVHQYKLVKMDPSIGSYTLDYTPVKFEFTIVSYNTSGVTVRDQLVMNGMDINFNQHVTLELNFKVRSIRFSNKDLFVGHSPECLIFHNKLIYSSFNNFGGVEYYLDDSNAETVDCIGEVVSDSGSYDVFIIFVTILDIVIIMMCVVSIVFTFHTFRRAFRLGKAMGDFYQHKLRIKLSWWKRKSLFSVWSIFTFFCDTMLIVGSGLKILLQFDVLLNVIVVRLLIGTALVVQAAALMRYFSFFRRLNALTRTLSAAYPELLKFLICTSLLYFAFALCGLIVFGPYAGDMFSNFGNSVEILFALINGDSIWLVFRSFDSRNTAVYVYSRFYVYIFIFLFIYAVLNLFTSIVKTSYDESLNVDRAVINEVRRFIFSGPLTPNGVALRDVTNVNKYVDPRTILRQRKKSRNETSISDFD